MPDLNEVSLTTKPVARNKYSIGLKVFSDKTYETDLVIKKF